MSAPVFTLPLSIREEDIDRQGHINNVAFLRYVQEAAIAHWQSAAPADWQTMLTWVVRKHEIEYLKPGLPNDSISARTWVGEASGATWDRFTEIVRGDSVVLVSARTVWVLLDAASGRPRRVDRTMVDVLMNRQINTAG